MRSAFERLDRDFCNLCTKDGRDWDSGSTAIVAHIVDNVVTLANLGDCRGVVCRMVSSDEVDLDGWENLDADNEDDQRWDRANGGDTESNPGKLYWKEMTETHSPLLSGERARIENANGWIIRETEIPTGQLHRMDFFDKDVIEIVKRCFADRLKQHRSDPVRQIQIARTCGESSVHVIDIMPSFHSPHTSQAILLLVEQLEIEILKLRTTCHLAQLTALALLRWKKEQSYPFLGKALLCSFTLMDIRVDSKVIL
jgi:hypothetical protein